MSDKNTMHEATRAVLDFWFADTDEGGADVLQPFWFKSTPETDEEIRTRFQALHARAADGAFDDLAETADDHLAVVILLDQVPRNIYRGTPDAFASDPAALQWSKRAVERGLDLEQGAPYRRMFFYLPFEHAEDMSAQNEAVRLFEQIGDDELTSYAVKHRDVIEKFGRFPHRNAFLDRRSTPDEEEYLSQPGAGF